MKKQKLPLWQNYFEQYGEELRSIFRVKYARWMVNTDSQMYIDIEGISLNYWYTVSQLSQLTRSSAEFKGGMKILSTWNCVKNTLRQMEWDTEYRKP